MTLVSIVLPTFNRYHVLGRAIDSVLAQTYKEWELIIIDNHSSDQSQQLITSYRSPKIKFFKFHNHGIIAKSRNQGILRSQGEHVAFLDSDDWWTSQKLEISLKYLNKYRADLVYHDLYQVKSNNQLFNFKKRKGKALTTPVFEDLIHNGSQIINSSVLVKKSCLEEIGLISEDPRKVTWEDYDTWIRLSKITDAFKKIPHTLGYYWDGSDNLTTHKQTISNIREIKKYFENADWINKCYRPWWMSYSSGRSYYLLGEYDYVIKELSKTRQFPLIFEIKKYYMLIVCRLKGWLISK
jgi:glycosyltransferase involved in cell wall biosynthesis